MKVLTPLLGIGFGFLAIAVAQGCAANASDGQDGPLGGGAGGMPDGGGGFGGSALDRGADLSFAELVGRWSAERSEAGFALGQDIQEFDDSSLYVTAGSFFGLTSDETCAEKEAVLGGRSADGWMATLHLSDANKGLYAAQAEAAYGEPKTAQLVLTRFDSGERVEEHTSVGGTLEVLEVPTGTGDVEATGTLRVKGDALFLASDVNQGEGGGGGADSESPRLVLTMDWTGSYCPAYCEVTGGLSGFCEKDSL